MAIHHYLLKSGETLRLSAKGVEVGTIRHPLDHVRGVAARVLSRRMSIDLPGGPLPLEFTDRKTREAAMEAMARLLGGSVVRKGAWGRVEIRNSKL